MPIKGTTNMCKKSFYFMIPVSLICLLLSSSTQGVAFPDEPQLQGPVSFEPSIEKDGIRVTLKTSLNTKNRMTVLVRVANFTDHPILVSPDAMEASTEEGFTIPPSAEPAGSVETQPGKAWQTMDKLNALIPFDTPFKIVKTARGIKQFAEKAIQNSENKDFRKKLLREVILPPGMATRGLVVYDTSILKAFEETPALHIKVKVGEEPFEFRFRANNGK